MKIPYGINCLFIRCYNQNKGQFSGIVKLLKPLKKKRGFFAHYWDGNRLDLNRRRKLKQVIISGHGTEFAARFSGDSPLPLTPEQIRFPGFTALYLLGCFQGRDVFRKKWAEGSGISIEHVRGSDGETESALSVCLLLHIMEDGPESLERWFPVWISSNAYLRPHFPLIRELYRKNRQNPVHTINALSVLIDLTPLEDFLEVAFKYPDYLSDLLD